MNNSYYFSTQGTGLTFLVSPLLPAVADTARSLVNCGLVPADVPFRNACMVSSPGYKTKEKESIMSKFPVKAHLTLCRDIQQLLNCFHDLECSECTQGHRVIRGNKVLIIGPETNLNS